MPYLHVACCHDVLAAGADEAAATATTTTTSRAPIMLPTERTGSGITTTVGASVAAPPASSPAISTVTQAVLDTWKPFIFLVSPDCIDALANAIEW